MRRSCAIGKKCVFWFFEILDSGLKIGFFYNATNFLYQKGKLGYFP